MKVIKLTALKGKEEVRTFVIFGPGMNFDWSPANNATVVSTVNGAILIKEKPDEIIRLIEGETNGI